MSKEEILERAKQHSGMSYQQKLRLYEGYKQDLGYACTSSKEYEDAIKEIACTLGV